MSWPSDGQPRYVTHTSGASTAVVDRARCHHVVREFGGSRFGAAAAAAAAAEKLNRVETSAAA